jgi:hypothetical protein
VALSRSRTAALRAPQVGLEAMAKDAGLDLYSLRFEDASESRKKWCGSARARPPLRAALPHPAAPWRADALLRRRLEANPAPPAAKDKRAPKWRPLGKAKPVYVPKWKQAKLDALPADKRAAALAAFTKRWYPAPVKA